jgi:hypothetical protein
VKSPALPRHAGMPGAADVNLGSLDAYNQGATGLVRVL